MATLTRQVNIRLSDAEYEIVQAHAKELGLDVSSYIRRKATEPGLAARVERLEADVQAALDAMRAALEILDAGMYPLTAEKVRAALAKFK